MKVKAWAAFAPTLIGKSVRLKIDRRVRPVIKHFYNDVEGGVILDRMCAGYYSWNIEDLEYSNGREIRITEVKAAKGGRK